MSTTSFYYKVFNELPMAIFIVDDDVRMKFLNIEALKLITEGTEIYDKRGGEVLHCIYAYKDQAGCGHAEECKKCLIRNSVNEAIKGNKTYRVPTILELGTVGDSTEFHAIVTATPFTYNFKKLVMVVVENANELMQLRRIIPMCSHCKKVRDDENYWVEVEQYFDQLTNVDFTFSLCRQCAEELYPDKKK